MKPGLSGPLRKKRQRYNCRLETGPRQNPQYIQPAFYQFRLAMRMIYIPLVVRRRWRPRFGTGMAGLKLQCLGVRVPSKLPPRPVESSLKNTSQKVVIFIPFANESLSFFWIRNLDRSLGMLNAQSEIDDLQVVKGSNLGQNHYSDMALMLHLRIQVTSSPLNSKCVVFARGL